MCCERASTARSAAAAGFDTSSFGSHKVLIINYSSIKASLAWGRLRFTSLDTGTWAIAWCFLVHVEASFSLSPSLSLHSTFSSSDLVYDHTMYVNPIAPIIRPLYHI